MSRVGKMPIKIPDGVNVNISGQEIMVECSGKKLVYKIHEGVKAGVEDGQIIVVREDNSIKNRELHGLNRTLINNMVIGVKEGFKKNLELVGRGKKAKVQGKSLILEIGLSHAVNFQIPDGIEVKVEKNIIEISGTGKQEVGQVSAEIRAFQPPEPYKGSGIRYEGERVRKKAGKTAIGSGFAGAGK